MAGRQRSHGVKLPGRWVAIVRKLALNDRFGPQAEPRLIRHPFFRMNNHRHASHAADSSHDELYRSLTYGFEDETVQSIQLALNLALDAKEDKLVRPRGTDVAVRLKRLGVDAQTLQAALLSDPFLRDHLEPSYIEDHFGETVANLVRNVNRLNTFSDYSADLVSEPEQAEVLRRMLLAMIDDVRALPIKLAYRVVRLRILPRQSYEQRLYIAREALDIYVPLANRLGIGQLKWELEDLAFRYLDPQAYKRLATALAENRVARERYIQDFIEHLHAALTKEGIEADVYGRPKHIYSIWRKMQRKAVDFNELYDLRAVRVIVDKVPTCYAVLGVVHTLWQYVPKEFDDYIANPKENGYQSLHTIVVGPGGAMVEIQIRTRDMHNFAELGVAAHWRYKEGGKQNAAVEKSIVSLRRLLENRDDATLLEDFRTELYPDRVFVLTPKGEVKDLMKGATPLDFAYAIHTEVGHRCRGAKVGGRIVPLTYELKSGDRVEIMTVKEGRPSRSWLNLHLGYLKTSHARSKVRHWFKKQDHERNLQDGKAILEKERQRLGLKTIDLRELTRHFRLSRQEDVLIGIGRADISLNQLAGALEAPDWRDEPTHLKLVADHGREARRDNVSVQGIGNLLTTYAGCCKPLPGDAIIGYITLGKGIAIHRQDCENILQLPEEKHNRLIEVQWGEEPDAFPVEIHLRAFDRQGLLRDITQILSNEHVNILEANTHKNVDDQRVWMNMTLEVRNITQLRDIMDKIGQLHNVFEVRRKR